MTMIVRVVKKTTTVLEVASVPDRRGHELERATSYNDHKKEGDYFISRDEPEVVEKWRAMTTAEIALWTAGKDLT